MAVSPNLAVSSKYGVDPAPTHDEKHRTQASNGAIKQDLGNADARIDDWDDVANFP